MSTNTKFTLWIASIAIFAFIAGRFTPPGTVSRSHQTPRTTSSEQKKFAANTSTNHAVNSAPSVAAGSTAGRSETAAVSPVLPAPLPGTATISAAPKNAAPVHPPSGRWAPPPPKPPELTISELYNLIEAKPASIKCITFVNGKNEVLVEREGLPASTVRVPDDGGKHELRSKIARAHIAFKVQETAVDPVVSGVSYMLPSLLIVGVILYIYFASRRAQRQQSENGGPVGQTGFGASKAKDAAMFKNVIKKTTFADVAGCEEAVLELRRVVKGLVSADVYKLFQAELPRGVLLIGPPGTGKTLLAKAVAGEVDGGFAFLSGSDFVEMYVGVGSSRVRDLFATARRRFSITKRPQVIFIDEIDAIGGKRGGGTSSGSNSEREQTLNQILVEMDGMISNEGIIVLAATNRVDMLDEALLRPGRFDCHVSVDLPDKAGREAIFGIHIGDRHLANEVTLPVLAHRTYGYSGAEIKGVCNRAAILAAERYAARKDELEQSGVTAEELKSQLVAEVALNDFDEGIDFVRYGNAAKSKQARMTDLDKRNTAYHEAGHACASAVLPDSDPVVKITIMRRSKALGYVQYMPDTDRVSITDRQALARIITAMAGRAAQEIFLGTVDAGASNDFTQGAQMARRMVASWGMSTLGHISVSPDGEQIGPELANEIDRECRRIIEECYQAARAIVQADKERIEALVIILMDKETVLADEWNALLASLPSAFNDNDKLPKANQRKEAKND
jgi:cell division protease FtsH